MSIYAVTRLPRELDYDHVMCRRCGIIKTRRATTTPSDYTCKDCTPYWKDAA